MKNTRYAFDYRLVFYTSDSPFIKVTTPTGETDINSVKKGLKDIYGDIEFNEIDLNTFLSLYPKDRIFRNAWQLKDNKILEDLGLSREIIREKRNKHLEKLDLIAFNETRKPKGKVELIDNSSQLLRDVPQQESFLSSDINDLRGLSVYMDNIIASISLQKAI